MTSKVKAHFASIVANLIFAANYSIVKIVTPSVVKPLGLNVLRVVVSVILFWSLFVMKPSNPGIQKRHLLRFFICAATGVAINQLLFIKGLSMTTSIHASLLNLATPVFITILAAWFLKERLTITKIAGLFLAIGGGILLILSKETGAGGTASLIGDILVLINALSYSFYLVMVRPLMHAYSPVHVLRWVFTIGTLLIVPFGWQEFSTVAWSTIHGAAWLALGFIAIGATFLAYLFNVYSIRTIGSSATGTYIYSQPFFAALIAALIFGERLSGIKILSAVLILAGVFLVNVNLRNDSVSTDKEKQLY